MFNEPISPPSSTPSSPPYYTISSDSEPYDPQSLTLAQLQARALATQQKSEPEANIPPPHEQPTTPPSEQPTPPPFEQPTPPPSEQPTTPPSKQPITPPSETPIVTPFENIIIPTSEPPTETTHTPPASPSPTPEPEPTFPTLEEAITLFVESLVEKIRSLSENSGISDNPSAVRIHYNRVIRWMTSEVLKLKGLFEQVRSDFIREAGERLQACLVREAEEKAKREAEEKARLEEEKRVREAAEKAVLLRLLLKRKQK
ncbi:vegetative cell wall protein gp1-like [Lathyrus oleraceus]|uniref:vegetative cell wall protein gp1-like n=1 Tax=Pisum sativum TaxID=3888 RepID=UPI0021CE373E|nr:vegetative cell wall protein gp1-like [Pisum sativum]